MFTSRSLFQALILAVACSGTPTPQLSGSYSVPGRPGRWATLDLTRDGRAMIRVQLASTLPVDTLSGRYAMHGDTAVILAKREAIGTAVDTLRLYLVGDTLLSSALPSGGAAGPYFIRDRQ